MSEMLVVDADGNLGRNEGILVRGNTDCCPECGDQWYLCQRCSCDEGEPPIAFMPVAYGNHLLDENGLDFIAYKCGPNDTCYQLTKQNAVFDELPPDVLLCDAVDMIYESCDDCCTGRPCPDATGPCPQYAYMEVRGLRIWWELGGVWLYGDWNIWFEMSFSPYTYHAIHVDNLGDPSLDIAMDGGLEPYFSCGLWDLTPPDACWFVWIRTMNLGGGRMTINFGQYVDPDEECPEGGDLPLERQGWEGYPDPGTYLDDFGTRSIVFYD